MIQKVTSVNDQLEQILRGRIVNGVYAADSRMPPESILAEELGISRPTLRTVLTKLETEGLITRKQGYGTYVNKHVISVDATPKAFWNFNSLIEDSGRAASTKILSVEHRHLTEQEASFHRLSGREKFMMISMVFMADQEPVIYSMGFIPLKLFVQKREQYDFNRPINVYIKEYLNQEISYSVSDISASFASEPAQNVLGISPNTPVLRFVDFFYNLRNQGLLYGISYFCDDLLRIRVAHSWG